MNKEALNFKDITIAFGGLKAIDSLSFDVKEGEIVGIIGPNGAGKTTLFNIISRFYKQDTGKIEVFSEDASSLKPHDVINKGIVRTFQNVELFKHMTVLDNLLVGQHRHLSYNIFSSLIMTKKVKKIEEDAKKKAFEILTILGIENYAYYYPINLPYGIQKKVELARALVSNPKILILDEPAAGMNDTETIDLSNKLRELKEKFKLTIIVIEHHMPFVMNICDRVVVLNFGKKIAEGTPDEIKSNPLVIEAYLG
ncbi:MAG: ABC transporter ATP-binding protein [Caloramator sp.]|nr:ABC transporter ATP-binding protein [Caloramator sp.]